MQINTKTHEEDESHIDERLERNAAFALIKENRKKEVFRDKRQEMLDSLKNKDAYTRSRLKIRFPDNFVILASFGAKESVQDVYNFIKDNLVTQDREFYLYETPPKRVLKASTSKLHQVKLVPSGNLYFGWTGLDQTTREHAPFLNLQKLKQYVTAFWS